MVKTNSFNELELIFFLCVLAAAITEFSPERKKQQQYESLGKQTGKKKRAAVTKKMLRSRPARYHFLIPPNTPDAVRIELEQRQKPVSITHIFMKYIGLTFTLNVIFVFHSSFHYFTFLLTMNFETIYQGDLLL